MSDEGIDKIAEQITRDWMLHLGHPATAIAEAERNHHTPLCEFEGTGWLCVDEFGNSNHPVVDEMADAASLVMFVREHPAVAAEQRVLAALGPVYLAYLRGETPAFTEFVTAYRAYLDYRKALG